MTATPSEVSALVAAGWVPSRYSVWTASRRAAISRRGEETLHVIIVAEPEPAADKVRLLLPCRRRGIRRRRVLPLHSSGPYWTSPAQAHGTGRDRILQGAGELQPQQPAAFGATADEPLQNPDPFSIRHTSPSNQKMNTSESPNPGPTPARRRWPLHTPLPVFIQ